MSNLYRHPLLPQSLLPALTAKYSIVDWVEQEFNLASLKGTYSVLIFFPGAWHPTSTATIGTFSEAMDKFDKLNCQVIGITTDTSMAIFDWLDDTFADKGLITLIADKSTTICSECGVLETSGRMAGHPTNTILVLDTEARIRYSTSLDRNTVHHVHHILRAVEAFQEVVTDSGDKLVLSGANVSENTVENKNPSVKEFYKKTYGNENEPEPERSSYLPDMICDYFTFIFSDRNMSKQPGESEAFKSNPSTISMSPSMDDHLVGTQNPSDATESQKSISAGSEETASVATSIEDEALSKGSESSSDQSKTALSRSMGADQDSQLTVMTDPNNHGGERYRHELIDPHA